MAEPDPDDIVDRPLIPTPPPHFGGPIPDGPLRPASAYYAWAEAAESLEHHTCTLDPSDVALPLRFIGHDGQPIVVWSDRPGCLITRMRARGAEIDCYSTLGKYVSALRCPDTIEGMPW